MPLSYNSIAKLSHYNTICLHILNSMDPKYYIVLGLQKASLSKMQGVFKDF